MSAVHECSLCNGRGYSIENPKGGKQFMFCDCVIGRMLKGWIEEFFIPKDVIQRQESSAQQ
jgi:hypothetical protein